MNRAIIAVALVFSGTARAQGCRRDLPRTSGKDGFWTRSRCRGDGLEAVCRECKRKRNRATSKKHRDAHAPPPPDPLEFDIDVVDAEVAARGGPGAVLKGSKE